jgi:hypothetical protein
MKATLHEQHLHLPNLAGEIQSERVIVASHIGRIVIERGLLTGYQRNVLGDVVPVQIPSADGIARSEESGQGSRLYRCPGHHNGIVALEPQKIVTIGWGRVERSSHGNGTGRPGNRIGKLDFRRQKRRLESGIAKSLLRTRRIVVEFYIVNVKCYWHAVTLIR